MLRRPILRYQTEANGIIRLTLHFDKQSSLCPRIDFALAATTPEPGVMQSQAILLPKRERAGPELALAHHHYRRPIHRIGIDGLREGHEDGRVERHIRRPVGRADCHRRRDCIGTRARREGPDKSTIQRHAIHALDPLRERERIGRRGGERGRRAEGHHCIAEIKTEGPRYRRCPLREGKRRGRDAGPIDGPRERDRHRRIARDVDQAHRRRDRADFLRRPGEIGIAILEQRIAVGIRHHDIGQAHGAGRHLHQHAGRREEGQHCRGLVPDLDSCTRDKSGAGHRRLLAALHRADIGRHRCQRWRRTGIGDGERHAVRGQATHRHRDQTGRGSARDLRREQRRGGREGRGQDAVETDLIERRRGTEPIAGDRHQPGDRAGRGRQRGDDWSGGIHRKGRRGRAGRRRHSHNRGTGARGEGNLKRGSDGRRCREHVAHEDAGIVRGQCGTGQISSSDRDIHRRACVAGVRRQARDRRRADAARVARDGKQVPNRIVVVCRDISLPVDHLR